MNNDRSAARRGHRREVMSVARAAVCVAAIALTAAPALAQAQAAMPRLADGADKPTRTSKVREAMCLDTTYSLTEKGRQERQ